MVSKRKIFNGSDIIEFTDIYGAGCSIQKSSLKNENSIWFGVDIINPIVPTTRMHLNQEQVAELLPILQKFVETGDI